MLAPDLLRVPQSSSGDSAGSTYGQACQFIFANTKNIFMKNITTSTSVGVVVWYMNDRCIEW